MDHTRRDGLWKLVVGVFAAAIAGIVGIPVVGAFVAPMRRRRTGAVPHATTSLRALTVDTPKKIEVLDTQNDAWDRGERKPVGAAWLVLRADGQVDAYSAVCPHLACPVGYDADHRVFACPCHESAFARSDGARLKGPSPRGLDPLPVVVRGDVVDLTYVRFMQGIATRKET